MDSLFPFLQGLAPLQHVGLSRRTPDDRDSGRYSFLGLGKWRPQFAHDRFSSLAVWADPSV